MNLRTTAASIALAASVAAGVTACAPQAASSDGPTSLVMAVATRELDVNFKDASGAGWLFYASTQAVYEPLVRRNAETGELEGVLASEFTISDDSRTVEFTIRDGVSFTDGEALTAEGVAQVLDFALNDENAWSSFLQSQYGIELSVAGSVLTITTTRPVGRYDSLDLLEWIPIVSPAALDGSFGDDPYPGTGPYVVEEIVPESSVSYVPNPDYWNADYEPFDSLVIRAFDDQVSALNALKSGQVDVAEVGLSLIDEAEASGFTVHQGQFLTQFLTIFGVGDTLAPELADVRVRQAMNLAFDRKTIAETLGGGYGRASSQPFLPGRLEYVEGGDDRYAFDPGQARALMAEAGYGSGFTVQVGTYSGHPSAAYEPVIEQALADIGITVEWVRYVDGGGLAAAAKDGVDAILVAGNGDNPGQIVNSPRAAELIDDPVWDELVEIRRTGTLAENDAISAQLAEYVLDNALYVAFAQDPILWVSTPEFEIAFPPLGVGFVRLPDISLAD